MSVLVCVGFKKKQMTSGFGICLHLICTGIPKVGSKSWNSISNHPRGAAGVLPRKTNALPSRIPAAELEERTSKRLSRFNNTGRFVKAFFHHV